MSLDELRNELAQIDRSLLELVARRQKAAAAIGREKLGSGIATRNYKQELDVIRRAREAAAALDLSGDVAEELMLLLIRSSLTVQEQGKIVAEGEGSGKRVLVIGGAGQMGRWMVRFLSHQGYEVEVADPSGPVEGCTHYADWNDATLDHHMIVVAAPLEISGNILLALAEKKPTGLVFDVGSLKSPLRAGLQALADAGVRVTSLHPMFGANTELLTNRHLIVIDLGNEEANQEASDLFASTMVTRVSMDLESHDRLIAYILGLSHALNIAFFTALAESGEAAPKLAELSSTTFDAQLEVASRVAEESPDLYFEIQHLNDYGTESLSALLLAVERLRSVVRAGDAKEFTRLMNQGREYLRLRQRET